MHHIYLIPGFFGFANFGDIMYFAHVREVLGAAMLELGEKAEIHYVRTLPTASLLHRASTIANTIAESGAGEGDSLHLVGHSSGGLDARLFTSPGISLHTPHDVEAQAKRVTSVVAIASPHYGTPQATLFASLAGQQLLRTLSVLTLHGLRLGSMPLSAMIALAGTLPRIGRFRGPVSSILDQVYEQLLRNFDDDRRGELEEFLSATTDDQSLLPQLTCETMQLLNATTSNRPTVRYGSVVTQARPPSVKGMLQTGASASGQAVYSLYRALYELAGNIPESMIPPLSSDDQQTLRHAFGAFPDARCNDAIVPTRSQVWGEIIHAVWADHLDVIGHFHGDDTGPRHFDWLSTQSHFSRVEFEELWFDIARFLFRDSQQH